MQTSYNFYFGASQTAVVKNTYKFNGQHNFQAQMKAAEELRQKEEEEEKRKIAERRREEKRLEREVRSGSYLMDVHTEAELQGSEDKKQFFHATPCRILKIMSLCVSAQRQEEKQRQLKRQKELMTLAHQHYRRTSLLWRGLTPWKRLVQLRRASVEVNHLSCPFQLVSLSGTQGASRRY